MYSENRKKKRYNVSCKTMMKIYITIQKTTTTRSPIVGGRKSQQFNQRRKKNCGTQNPYEIDQLSNNAVDNNNEDNDEIQWKCTDFWIISSIFERKKRNRRRSKKTVYCSARLHLVPQCQSLAVQQRKSHITVSSNTLFFVRFFIDLSPLFLFRLRLIFRVQYCFFVSFLFYASYSLVWCSNISKGELRFRRMHLQVKKKKKKTITTATCQAN